MQLSVRNLTLASGVFVTCALALLLALLPPPAALGVLAGILMVAVCVWKGPKFVLASILLLSPLLPMREKVGSLTVGVLEVGVATLLVVLVIRRRLRTFDWVPGLLLLAYMITTMVSPFSDIGLGKIRLFIQYWLIYVVTVDQGRSRDASRNLLAIFALSGVLLVFRELGALKDALGSGLVLYRDKLGEITYGVNILGGYLAMVAPITLVMARGGRRWFWRVAFLLTALGSLITLSRGAIVGMVIGVAYVLLKSRRYGVLAVATAALGLFLLSGNTVDIGLTGVDRVMALDDRLSGWQAAIQLFSTHIVFGVGPGAFPQFYPLFAAIGVRDDLLHAHNFILQVAAETGIVGLFAHLAVFGVMFHRARYALHQERDVLDAVVAALIVFLAHNVLDYSYNDPLIATSVWFLLGLLVANYVEWKGAAYADRTSNHGQERGQLDPPVSG